jgi:L-rhamnose 1-dehydrogenase
VKLLEGKTVLVTGASTGIGKAAAIGCAQHGADVAINYHSDEAGARTRWPRSRRLGRRAIAVKGDVAEAETATEPSSRRRSRRSARSTCSCQRRHLPLPRLPRHAGRDMERTMQVNLLGAYYMVQAAANQMVKQGHGGAIIAVSSISALVGGAYQTHYTPTKAGRPLADAVDRDRARQARHPLQFGAAGHDPDGDQQGRPRRSEKRDYMAGRIPLGRLGEPEDLAGPIVFLASDMARYVTGAALLVDGGAFVNLQ